MNFENSVFDLQPAAINTLKGRKILFACFPADGHFNPLTGLAVFLKEQGCDVRWYTSKNYADKLKKIGIAHYPFVKAIEIINEDFDETFPERKAIKSQIKKLKFDMINLFVLPSSKYYEDILEIREEFAFDAVIADCAFPGIPYLTDKMNVPVIAIGVFPLTETSKDLPPIGLGMTPSYSFLGKLKQAVLRAITNKMIFGEPNRVLWKTLEQHGIGHKNESIFDMLIRKSSVFLQVGTPGFEYKRSDMSPHIHFIGALLPWSAAKNHVPWEDERLHRYERIILVTQGTVERDVEKILVPTLEAFKGTDTLIIATTGGSGTEDLRKRFPEQNLIIEDFIPFADVMPYADIYITNGGYGGVMLGIENELPMVVAGKHEGKNEINARVGYFGLGVNLKTETPGPAKIRNAVEKIYADASYKKNVVALAGEFRKYEPKRLLGTHLEQLVGTPVY